MTRRLAVPIASTALALGIWLCAGSVEAQARRESADDALGFGESDGVGTRPSPTAGAGSDDSVGFGESTAPASGPDPAASGAPAAEAESESAEPSPLSLGGRYRLRNAFWTERARNDPWAQGRSLLGLWARYSLDFSLFGESAALRVQAGIRGEYDAAYLVDRARYDAPTLETYEWQVIREESYLSLALGALELSAGLLKLQLGPGEVLGLVNVLNPRDLRDPGLTDADDLLLPVLASRLSLSLGAHRFDAMVVYEAYFGLRAPPLGELSPLRALIAGDPLAGPELLAHTWRYRDTPRGFAPGSSQALARYTFSSDGLDLALYAATVLDKLGVAELPPPRAFDSQALWLDNFHPRYPMLAHSGALTIGDALLRWEASAELDRPETVRTTGSALLQLDMERHTQLGALLGLTYFGIANANFGLELQQSYVLGNPARRAYSGRELLFPIESTSVALRATIDLLRERLQLSVVGVLIGIITFNGALARAEASYLLADGVRAALGYLHYQPSRHFGPFFGFERDDRAYLDLRWDFTLL